MFRFWYGPVIGRTLSDVWQGYAAAIFLEFGRLRPADYVLRDGSPGAPKGELGLTTADRSPAWELSLKGKPVVTSETGWRIREHALRRLLIGRRLRFLEIDDSARATRLTFTHGLVLRTWDSTVGRCKEAHWELRLPTSGSDDRLQVVLGGL